MNGGGEFAAYDIMKNADIEGTFFVDAQHSYDIYSSSITVVVSLDVGDVLFRITSVTEVPHGNIFSQPVARSSVAGWRIQYIFNKFVCHLRFTLLLIHSLKQIVNAIF